MPKLLHPQGRTGNLVLDSLGTEEIERLPLKPVTLRLGQVVYGDHEHIAYVYFPTTSLISCLHTTQTGATAETAVIGNDGVLGTAVFLGHAASSHQAVTQVGGNAFSVSAKALQLEFARGGALQTALLRYTHALITQISQTAVCNRLHPLEQRLCRWLLLCHDRVTGSEVFMTQEVIANMLGGRRESVTVAAGHLQDLGLICYARGRIRIVSREGLERLSCECYDVVNRYLSRAAHCTPSRPANANSGKRDGEATLSARQNHLGMSNTDCQSP